jgi:valyl-tRNA synthetase
MAAQGRDIKLATVSASRATATFATKLWNACRFAEMNGVTNDPQFVPEAAELTVNRWILTELARARARRHRSDRSLSFQRCRQPALSVRLESGLRLVSGTAEAGRWLVCHADWPSPSYADDAAADEINWLIDLVSGIRSVRSEMNVPPAALAPLVLVNANSLTRERVARHDAAIKRLARVDGISLAAQAPKGAAQIIAGEATACLPLGTLIDLGAEKARLEKAIAKAQAEMDRINGKLSNEKFVANANPEVVAAERDRLEELTNQLASLRTALSRVAEAE